jgi:hypothetical protein
VQKARVEQVRRQLQAMSEQLKAATGLDMLQAVRERVAGKPVPPVRAGT